MQFLIREKMPFLLSCIALLLLACGSLAVGSYSIGFDNLTTSKGLDLFEVSRLPRTLALILCGASLSVSGLIMQMLTQNHFVEPSTAGSMQSAALGMLGITLLWPEAPILFKMGFISLASLAGTLVFLSILSRLSLKTALIVPLIGIMFGAVISALTTFIAIHFDLLQSLSAWTSGDFSGVLKGRYETLWIVAVVTVFAFIVADRFTLVGMGKSFATNLGVNYKRTMFIGVLMVAIVSGIVVATVGILPFLGLIVPNIIRRLRGDNVRHNLPWIALLGAGLVLLCDLIGRLILFPFELPVGTILGVIGAAIFLYVLIRGPSEII